MAATRLVAFASLLALSSVRGVPDLPCYQSRQQDDEPAAVAVPQFDTTKPAVISRVLDSVDDWRVVPVCWDSSQSCVDNGQVKARMQYTDWKDAYTTGEQTLECSTISETATYSSTSTTVAGDVASLGSSGSWRAERTPGTAVQITMTFSAAVDVFGYRVGNDNSQNDRALDPAAWLLEGFDGAEWVKMHENSRQAFWQGQQVNYLVDRAGSFSQLRFSVTETNDPDAVELALGLLALRTCAASPVLQEPVALRTVPTRQGSFAVVAESLKFDFLPTAGPVVLDHQIAFQFRMNAANRVESNSPAYATLRVMLIKWDDTRTHVTGQGGFDIVPTINANGDQQNYIEFANLDNTQWQWFTAEFTLDRFCGGCTFVVYTSYNSWVHNAGNQEYFANATVRTLETTVPARAMVTGAEHSHFEMRKPDITLPLPHARDNCPHLDPELMLWHNATTWAQTTLGTVPTPNPTQHIVLPENTKVLIQRCSLTEGVYGLIEVPASSWLVFDDANIRLETVGIVTHGSLFAGSETCRLFSDIEIVLHGNKSEVAANSVSSKPTKGIVATGYGSLDLHGKEFVTWTRLATTAWPGDTILAVQDPVDWEVGQKIVLVTTVWRDEEDPQNEVFTVRGVSADGLRVQLDDFVKFKHYGGAEYQAEVGLLSRRITVRGDSSSAAQRFGGHMMAMQSASARFSGVAAVHMGQENHLARYPFHFHMLNDCPSCYVRDSAIVSSFYRCVVVHGTNKALVSRNVAFDVSGHCYYLEDGVEELNTLEYNLGAFIHVIFRNAAGGGQPGEWFIESDELRNPADTSAAAFYITNAYNNFVGNAASGGWTGFAFPNLRYPINLHRGQDFSSTFRNPSQRPTLVFDGNTAHSSGYQWNRGSCLYVGGRLEHESSPPYRLRYLSGRESRSTVLPDVGSDSFMQFNNTLLFLCRRAVNHWGNRLELSHVEAHDVLRGAVLFGTSTFFNSLVNAHSGNNINLGPVEGFQFYDTWTSTLVYNIVFRNFVKPGDNVFSALTHSDTFKPQAISQTRQITYDNVDRDKIIFHNIRPTGSAWMFNFLDTDGSATLTGVPTIVGAHIEWWNAWPDCEWHEEWDVWTCPQHDNRSIAHIFLEVPGITRTEEETNTYESHRHVGYARPLGDTDYRRALVLSKNPGTTGPGDIGWELEFFAGSPTSFSIETLQIPRGHFVVLAFPYPSDTVFNVTIFQQWYWPQGRDLTLPEADSLEQLLTPTEKMADPSQMTCPANNADPIWCDGGSIGPMWFFDGSRLYLRVVNLMHYYWQFRNSELGFSGFDMDIPLINNQFLWRVEASCPKLCPDSPVCTLGDNICLPLTAMDIPSEPIVDFCSNNELFVPCDSANASHHTLAAEQIFQRCWKETAAEALSKRVATCKQRALDAFVITGGSQQDGSAVVNSLAQSATADLTTEAPPSSSSGSDAIPMIAGICGAVVIVLVAVGIALRHRSQKRRKTLPYVEDGGNQQASGAEMHQVNPSWSATASQRSSVPA